MRREPLTRNTGEDSSLTNLSTKRQRIAELARTKRGVALSSLHHVIDLEWMKEAYRLTRKDGALGIDGVTAADYATKLEANLLDLLDRIKSGRYKAPPVRRTDIPKADGSRRPLGIPTFEDKLAQRATTIWQKWLSRRDRRSRFPRPGLCTPTASPSAGSPDRPSLHLREQSSSMKNRQREICTSGTVRDEAGTSSSTANDRVFVCLGDLGKLPAHAAYDGNFDGRQ